MIPRRIVLEDSDLAGARLRPLENGGVETAQAIATELALHLATGHGSSVLSCAFSPKGDRVLSGSSDNTLKLWDAASGECLRTFSGHGNSVLSCAFSLEGDRVLSGSSDNTLKLWDAASGECLRTFSGHGGWVRSCAFSPKGDRVLSG